MSKTDWTTKLEDLISECSDGDRKDFANANAAAVKGTIDGRGPDSSKPDPDVGARVVFNISSVHVPLFVAASLRNELKPYKNGYDLGKYRIGGSVPGGGFKPREIVDGALPLAETRQDEIYFGAVELNGAGVRFYGDICLVLRRDALVADTVILDRNSYDLIRGENRD